MDIGTKLKEIRESHNMTQEETAKLFNISYQALSNYERGVRDPNKEFLIQFAAHFNVDKWELINIYFGISVEDSHEPYVTKYPFLTPSQIAELPESELSKIRDHARFIYENYRKTRR